MRKLVLSVFLGLTLLGCASRSQMLCDSGRCLQRWDVCSINCKEWDYRDKSPYCTKYAKDSCLDCETIDLTEKEAAIKDAEYQCNDKNHRRHIELRDRANYYPECDADPDEETDFDREMKSKYPTTWKRTRRVYGPQGMETR